MLSTTSFVLVAIVVAVLLLVWYATSPGQAGPPAANPPSTSPPLQTNGTAALALSGAMGPVPYTAINDVAYLRTLLTNCYNSARTPFRTKAQNLLIMASSCVDLGVSTRGSLSVLAYMNGETTLRMVPHPTNSALFKLQSFDGRFFGSLSLAPNSPVALHPRASGAFVWWSYDQSSSQLLLSSTMEDGSASTMSATAALNIDSGMCQQGTIVHLYTPNPNNPANKWKLVPTNQ